MRGDHAEGSRATPEEANLARKDLFRSLRQASSHGIRKRASRNEGAGRPRRRQQLGSSSVSGTSSSSPRANSVSSDELLEKVKRELVRYEHPLFDFDARAATGGIEVEIRFRPAGAEVQTSYFLLQPREIEHSQFPWSFQRQLYDCLHDYVIEMFVRNPQRQDA